MSDALWVGVTVAVSTLLGSGITALVTHKVTKRQADAQMEIHRQDLKERVDEARKGRIVESRKPLLLEIRETLGHALGSYHNFVGATLVIQDSQSMNLSAESIAPVEQRQKANLELLREALERVTQLIPQISDTTLKSEIETYMASFNIAMPQTDLVPNSPGVESYSDAPTALNAARQYLFVVNKRIEGLLAGDDPT